MVNDIPRPVFLIAVGYISDIKSKLTENTALTQNFPIIAIHNKICAFSETNNNLIENY